MVPMWLWLTFVVLAVVVGTIVGREERPHCIGCGRLINPSEFRATLRANPQAAPLCLDCFQRALETPIRRF